MAIEKKSLKREGLAARNTEDGTAKTTEPSRRGDAKRLAIAKQINAKLSTAKLATLRKLGG